MVPALIITALIFAALAALLFCAASSHTNCAEDRIALGNHGSLTTFVSELVSTPMRSATIAPRDHRSVSLNDQVAKAVSTSIKFCKFSSARRELPRWPQPIPSAEAPVRPDI